MTEHLTLNERSKAQRAIHPPEPIVRLSAAHKERLRRRLARRVAAWAGLLLIGYWSAAFVLTHLPMQPSSRPPFGIPNGDKVVHIALYAGLALLMSVWFGVRKRLGGATIVAAAVLCVLGLYATFDELTQIPVGRHADWRDWFADLAGIHLGLFGFFMLRRWVRR